MCPDKYPISLDWDDDLRVEEERKDQDKAEDSFSVCSGWEVDLKEQEWKNEEIEDQKDNYRKTPHKPQVFIGSYLYS